MVYGGKKVESSKWLIIRFNIFFFKCYYLKVKIKFFFFILLIMDVFDNEVIVVCCVDNFFISCLENCNFK